MKQLIFSTDGSYVGVILRLAAGAIMLPHGAQKMLGSFGGYGFNATMQYFTKTMGLPWLVGFLVIVIEFVGALALVLGFATKLWAIAFIAVMMGAIFTTSYSNGFFMNWFGNQQGEGFEYHLLMIAICIGILVTGCGRFGIDNILQPI
jgi:putative oxidoreductase